MLSASLSTESCSPLGAGGKLGLRLSVKENSCHSSQLFFLNIEFDTSHILAASERLDRAESRAQMSAGRWLWNLPEDAGCTFSHVLRGHSEV